MMRGPTLEYYIESSQKNRGKPLIHIGRRYPYHPQQEGWDTQSRVGAGCLMCRKAEGGTFDIHRVLLTIVLLLSTQRERGPASLRSRQALGSRRIGVEWLVAGVRAAPNVQKGIPITYSAARDETHNDTGREKV